MIIEVIENERVPADLILLYAKYSLKNLALSDE
jgi:magnesium-transporting ATPase (P-type)